MSVLAGLRAGGVSAANAKIHAPLAERAMLERGITHRTACAIFVAQVLAESVYLAYFEEIASGQAYEGRRDLGNVRAGDGKRYKGRGPIQLTGRANYRAAGAALGLPLEAHPELVATHRVGWLVAAWYFSTRAGLLAAAERGDFRQTTVLINGAATEGYPSHQSRRRVIYANVAKADCRPKASHLMADELRWVRELDELRRKDQDRGRQEVLVGVLTKRRKAIWRVAQPKAKGGDGRGWDVLERRKRWDSLRART